MKIIKKLATQDSDNGGSTLPLTPSLSGDGETITVSLTDRSSTLIDGLVLVLQHHAASQEVIRALVSQVHDYLDSSSNSGVWLKRCKYMLTYPIAKYLRNDLPPAPDKIFVPGGPLRAWMKIRLLVFSRRNTHLWYSWFQAKRSTLPLSDETVLDTYDSHYKRLSSRDEGDDDVIDEIFADTTFQEVLQDVRKSFTAKLKGISSFDKLSASSSACFENTRGMGGQNSWLLGMTQQILDPRSELMSMRWCPVGYTKGSSYLNAIFEVRAPFARHVWSQKLKTYLRLWDRKSPVNCTIQAILEPNKVRVISKGESLPYYSCRPLQRALHSAMREMAPFRLIGRTFCPTDIIDLADQADENDQWFSIDYSAATDGLSWKYSGRIFRFLIGNLPQDDYDMAMSVLGPHRLYYPLPCGGRYFRGMQQNGQLMGSILSFPILCLANLGTYLCTTRQHQRDWTHKQRLNHVLVNGDDMVYCAPEELWERQVQVAKAVGLEMSVGKAYKHPIYLNINSVSVHYDLKRLEQRNLHRMFAAYNPNYDDEGNAEESSVQRDLSIEPTPWQINYLNAGLFFGHHKVQGDDLVRGFDVYNHPEKVCQLAAAHMGQDPARGLVPNLNTVLSGSLPGRQTGLLKSFISTHSSRLNDETLCSVKDDRGRIHAMHRNIFLPLSVGGMGVLAPQDFRFRITESDRILAYSTQVLQPGLKTLSRPLPGYEPKELVQLVECAYLKPRGDSDTFMEFLTVSSKRKRSVKQTACGFVAYSSFSSSLFGEVSSHELTHCKQVSRSAFLDEFELLEAHRRIDDQISFLVAYAEPEVWT